MPWSNHSNNNLPVADHRNSLFESELHHLDVLTPLFQTAPLANAMIGQDLLLGDARWTGVPLHILFLEKMG